MLPVAGYTLYAGRYGPEEEQLEERIRERYQPDITAAHSRNKAMSDFFQKAIKDPDSGAEDSRLEQVLHGGKGEKKRFHAVDKELYGTVAGMEEKQRTEAALKQAAEEKKKRKRRKKKGMDESSATESPETATSNAEQQPSQKASTIGASSPSRFSLPQGTTQVVTVVAVGTVAAIVGFVIGGQRK
jgi:hypothetical protein